MIDVNPEVQGLQQSIEHAQLMVDACAALGTDGGEAFIYHLEDTDNGEQTISAAQEVQQGFAELLPAAEALLELLENQLSVKEASDAVGGEHGNKAFLRDSE